MTLRRKRFLLRTLASAVAVAAVGIGADVWRSGAHQVTPTDVTATSATRTAITPQEVRQPLAADESLWKRLLRRPIFDPPPPPPPVVVKQELPPIRAKLLGTILEPGNSQAMISLPSGSVEFRTVGQALGPDDGEATIVEIAAATVKVKRGEELTTLSVETILR